MTIAQTAHIYPWAKIIHSDNNFSIGEHSQIDDFAFINAGENCVIGNFVHISSFVSVIGGGEYIMGDYSGLSAGCRIITGSDDFTGPYMTNPTIPEEFTNYTVSRVIIGKHVIVGTNSIIYPGVTIGDGAAISAGSIVKKDLPAWGVYAGSPLRRIEERDQGEIQRKEQMLLEKIRNKQI
jgi:galactoside O-acetyltransferase